MAANIVKKLSMKVLLGNVANFIPTKEVTETKNGKEITKEVPDIGKTAWLVSVVGIARGVKRGVSNYGEWESLIGEFVAEALVGDKAAQRYRTGQLFLPDVVMMMVSGAAADNSGVEFAFKIGITADADAATGYVYTADFLVEPKANDPLEALLAQALPAPALPAPVKEKASA